VRQLAPLSADHTPSGAWPAGVGAQRGPLG
jgi:hypothetical protein